MLIPVELQEEQDRGNRAGLAAGEVPSEAVLFDALFDADEAELPKFNLWEMICRYHPSVHRLCRNDLLIFS